ncbi:MAG TPA: serine/threonine-protein kinase [Pyrinomonadaceae bacterium]|nr:serine/threonine-protein kinase [Pyrinomonadaceae bacterium]
MSSDPYIGQVLDEKYRLERLLGRGGMGAVYLSTHLGTERYVALKLITPQFMRNEEFVARFKREARAAGRLRHPNVVDVTDFGFAQAGTDAVAYLVMEYLDGCTLGDVLIEEKRLPLDWVVDILEQVCSAVHEAHQQGIVHRDLKPENIWLEPNRLGGYRVKVLDFGIAKLADSEVDSTNESDESTASQSKSQQAQAATSDLGATAFLDSRSTSADLAMQGRGTGTFNQNSEIDTLIYPPDHFEHSPKADDQRITEARKTHDKGTQVSEQIFAETDAKHSLNGRAEYDDDGDRTLMFGKATKQALADEHTRVRTNATRGTVLTRVGAIMGTPLYMSPEQCAGKSSDARSDIYSLGVIAYQMLAGEPPFAGATGNVMQEHIQTAPQPLAARNKKVRKRAAQVVMSALAKNPDERPQTAAAFASSLRAQAEGIGSLYRRAFSLYSEYFPKFLKLSIIAHLPVILTTLILIGFEVALSAQPKELGVVRILLFCGIAISGLLQVAAYFVAAAAISGMTAVIVTQLSLAPLRPVELRLAFAVLKRRWRPFLSTAIRVTLRIVIGFILLIIPGIVITIRYALYAPVVLMEGLEKKAAMRRARALASRSWRTIIIVSILQFLIPLLFSALLGRLTVVRNTESGIHIANRAMSHQIYQQLSGLLNIVIVPLMSIVPALLYLKMRQLGGENLADTLAEIEDADDSRSHWQERMRTRLSLHPSRGRTTDGKREDSPYQHREP